MDRYSGDDVNITAIHLLNMKDPKVKKLHTAWAEYAQNSDSLTMPVSRPTFKQDNVHYFYSHEPCEYLCTEECGY